MAYRIGRAYAEFLKPKRVVVGRDIRLSSNELCKAVTRGLLDSGVDVYDIGLCGTEGVYFATFAEQDGRRNHGDGEPQSTGLQRHEVCARAVPADQWRHGLKDIQKIAESEPIQSQAGKAGASISIRAANTSTIYCPTSTDRKLKKLKIVVNAGNGGAGAIIDQLESHLPFEFIKINHQPDGTFPNGVPNPMLEENRVSTIEAIRQHKQISALPGTVTTTAVFCSMRGESSSRATTSSACSRRFFSSANPAHGSFTIRA